MSDQASKHGNAQGHSEKGHGEFERRDIKTSDIVYFIIGLVVMTVLAAFFLRGLYSFLDHRERALQPAVNPLLTNVPEDTRKIPQKYPETAFPDPRLETDERTQLDDIRAKEEQALNSYGWADEKAGTVRIPIERAMDLLAQRGLPVHAQSDAAKPPAGSATETNSAGKSGKSNDQKISGKK